MTTVLAHSVHKVLTRMQSLIGDGSFMAAEQSAGSTDSGLNSLKQLLKTFFVPLQLRRIVTFLVQLHHYKYADLLTYLLINIKKQICEALQCQSGTEVLEYAR